MQSLVAHVGIPQQGIASSTWLNPDVELLQARDEQLPATDMADAPDYLALALTPRTCLREQVIIAASQLDPSSDAALSLAVPTLDDIVGVVGTGALAVRTGDLLLDHNL